MKIKVLSAILLVFISMSVDIFGQTASVAIDEERKAWIGINVGGFWQSSDVRSRLGAASGFTFDYYLIRNSTSLFGLGLRGQYLAAISTGLDVKRDYGIQNNTSLNGSTGNPNYASLTSPDNYVFQNHSTEVSDFSGNLIISLNRLRATTGIHLYLFGGLGGTGYITTLDQLDASGNLYNYSVVDPTSLDFAIVNDLKDLWDGDYETFGEDGSQRFWTLTPTIGAGFGIQLSQRIQLGLEHKVGFTGTDLLDGNQWDDLSQMDSKNDTYHYSAISVHIGLGKLSGVGDSGVKSDLNSSVPPPVINILEPGTSLYTSLNCRADIRATISNIPGKENITVKRSGDTMRPSEFTWNSTSRMLEIHESLNEATVTYSISTRNAGGSASRIVIINCETRQNLQPVVSPPAINITSPTTKEFESPDCQAQIIATITNITGQDGLRVTENGRSLNNQEFTYSTGTRTLRITKQISSDSRFVISAKNSAGSASSEVRITCVQPTQVDTKIRPPVLTVLAPASHPYTTADCTANLLLKTTNISEKNQITVFENGQRLSPVLYTFNSGNGNISVTRGLPGETDYLVKAENAAGSATVVQTFVCPQAAIEAVYITICHYSSSDKSNGQTISIPTIEWPQHANHGDIQGTCPVFEKPSIVFNNPTSSSVTVTDCRASINARITNIEDKEDIEVLQNGQPIPFSFSGSSVTINNYPFKGTSTFTIVVTNLAGTTTESVSFTCQPKSVERITICHSTRGAAPQTISIPATEWASHATHGDTQGTCPVIKAPVVSITSPASTPVTLDNCVASLAATVQNITDRSGITVTNNGAPVNFAFSGNTVTVSNIRFTGTSNFIVTARNTAGTTTQTVSFICKPPVQMITICHTAPGAAPQTISIPATEWASHASHGDTQGACPVIKAPVVSITSPASTPVTLDNCVASVAATVQNITDRSGITVTNNGAPVNFAFSGNTVTVSNIRFTGTSNFIVTARNTAGTTAQTVSFICKPPVQMITICHTAPGATPQTISIPATEWATHASHGDTQGACPVIKAPVVSITSPASTPVTLENCVASVAATVQNITDRSGITVTNNGAPVNFAFSGNTVTVSNIRFTGTANFIVTARNTAGTTTQTVSFICKPPVQMITICHYPPGNTSNPQALTIPESAWAAHASHGDTQGACPVIKAPVVSITSPASTPVTLENCVASVAATVQNITDRSGITVTNNGAPVNFAFSGNTITVSNIRFTGTANFIVTARNTAGTTAKTVSFICKPPVQMITICHTAPGATPQTISIPATEWASHASHGDTQGACPVIKAPVVSITSPASTPVTLENCVASVAATVQNITDRSGITVTNNGAPVNFAFSGNTVTVSNIRFTGTANFIVTARNTAGTTTQTVSFICKPPVQMITICHTAPGATPQTISIPATEWASHVSHGDTQGACPVIKAPVVSITSPASTPVTSENCVASVAATVQNITDRSGITVTNNGAPVNFAFSGNTVTVSNIRFTGTANFIVTARNTAGTTAKTVSFICKPPVQMIVICHYPPGNTSNPQALTIPESAWAAHAAHGDTQGACPVIKAPVVSITSPASTPVTLDNCVASVAATVQNITDRSGITVTNNGAPVNFAFSGNTVTVSNIRFTGTANFIVTARNTAGTTAQTVSFICKPPVQMITICHYPPGNTSNPQALTIPESAWAAHAAHGDTQGDCPVIQPPVVAITSPGTSSVTVEDCKASINATVQNVDSKEGISVTQNGNPVAFNYSGNAVRLSNVDFTGTAMFIITATNQAGTSSQTVTYVCQPEEEDITICHYPPGNTSNPQALTIPESAWAAHAAHGDTQGDCPAPEEEPIPAPEDEPKDENKKITICHYPPGNKKNPQTITISESAWPAHEKHGDTKGPCN